MSSNQFITYCTPGKGRQAIVRWLGYTAMLLMGLLQFPQSAMAQPVISRVEYYFDTDPGYGLATNLGITANQTNISAATIAVNPTTLSEGVHRLYVRAKSANGWSLTNRWLFYKPYGGGVAPPAPANPTNITRVEYYIDTDPGFGAATTLPITAGTNLQTLLIPVNQAALTEGVHRLYVRAKSSTGWSLTNKWLFYKPYGNGVSPNPPAPAPNIVAMEYFIDEDPGIGLANAVAINSLTDIASFPLFVNISTLAAGAHQLHVRAKDAYGNWSMVNTLDFTTNPGVPGNSVVVSSIDKTTFCSSETLKVSYDANGTFTGANTFKVFISNASGSFTSEREIGSVTTTITSGIINCNLPADITDGTGYKVRIKSSSPATTGPANASAITISQAAVPSVSISSNLGAGVCAGSNITFTATPTNGGVSPTYVWKVNGTDVGTGPNYQSTTLSAGDVVTAVLTSSVACVSSPTATSNSITVSFANVTPTVSISADPGTTICAGSNVTFTATSTNGGTSPQYAWFINNVLYTYGVSFSISTLANGDVVKCELTSNIACAVPATVTTNTLTFVVQTGVTYYQDADGDGYGNASAPLSSCAQPSGYVTNSTDCNDGNAAINPTTVWYKDTDNDGYSNGTSVTQCARPTGYKYAGELFATSGDCNDANAAINPGVSEVCGNGVDDNCNGQIDEACNTYTWYRDNDGDGFGDLNTTTTTTVNIAPAGYVANSSDCDDNNSDINAQYSFYLDNDGDGFGVPGSILVCAENATTPPAGYATNSTDCDDNNNDIHAQYSFFRDNDGDGYGVPGSISVCAENATTPPAGYATNSTDCDDNNSLIHAQYPFYLDNDADGYGGGNSVLICAVNAAAVPAGYSAIGGDCNDANAAINPTTVWYKDTDNDGYSDGSTLTQCTAPATYKLASALTATSGDCNDANAAVNPAATEVCNGIDDNCNGSIDEGVTTTYYRDADGDGYGNSALTTQSCSTPTGYVSNNTDCDDATAAINPTTVWYKDTDNDGYSNGTTLTQCTQPTGYKLATALTATSGDCNDANAAINPAATEICGNGVDENCNGLTDENCETFTWFQDLDGDGYGNPAVSTTTPTNTAPAGYVSNNTDCNDATAAINPTTVWYKDADNDGYSDGSTLTQCTAPATYKLASALTATSGDCNDANAAVNPAATEVCNGIDDNCNGSIDEGVTTTYYRDADGDGYGNSALTTQSCSTPTGYVSNNTDCDDATAAINPTTVWYKDTDNDGYSNGTTLTQCTQPTGYKLATALTATSGDCNDANAAINPAATEICGNGVDENCNGLTDENCETFTWFQDLDGDGYGNPDSSVVTPTNIQPVGYVSNNTDCDDSNAAYNPAAVWFKDLDDDGYGDSTLVVECFPPSGYKPVADLIAISGDCNDDDPLLNPATVWYKDADFDGYSDGTSFTQCEKPGPFGSNVYKMAGSLIATSGDCNDEDPAIHPDASEVCGNGVDDNCNGQIDEECEIYTYYQDADGDGYGNPAVSITTPGGDIAPPGYVANAGDCNDANAAINPAAPEICGNEVDENCNGQIDENCQSDFTWFRDLDADGYGDPAVSTTTPTNTAPAGYVSNNTDCDDNNAAINPTTVWYKDADNDGYSNGSTLTQCTQPASYKLASTLLATSGDCNDTNAAINPAATEVCGNGVDDNCNGQTDEDCTTDPCGGVIGVLYVNAAAPTSGTGSGWDCAIQQLRDAVAIANSNPAITQIWVAKGEYKTTSGTDRAATINITRAGLQILGGFAGTETSAAQANPVANVTSISGDIGVAGNKTDNSFHLLRISNLPASASGLRIQGFLLEKGNANLGDPYTSENVYGGAVIVKDVNAATSVLFNQCLFNANSSQIAGGALALYNTSSIQVENSAFWDNSSGYGGAVASYNSTPSFTKTIFKTNKATTNGGAVLALQGSTTFSKTGFDRNSSGQLGGAVYQEQANTVVSQVVFTQNTAGKSGGAIYQLQANSQVLNSTLFGNTASVSGGAIALATTSSTTAQNSIFWKNKQASQPNVAGADIAALTGSGSITAQYNLLQPGSSVPADNGGTITNNLRGTDPMFTNEASPTGPDGWLGYGTDGLELKPGSPAINVGSNTLAASLATDAKDNARIVCSTIDLGPVEYQTCTGLITKADPRLPKAVTVTGIKASVTNPFSSQLLIRYIGADKAEADISSLSGQKMWKGTVINKGQTQVNTATWASGLYQVTIRSNSGQPMVFKVMKVR